jgi:hypothetical protein
MGNASLVSDLFRLWPDQELLAAFHHLTWIEKHILPSALVQPCQELLVSQK